MINLFKEAFEWLLDKGILTAIFVVNLIYVLVFVVIMFVLNWYHKNH